MTDDSPTSLIRRHRRGLVSCRWLPALIAAAALAACGGGDAPPAADAVAADAPAEAPRVGALAVTWTAADAGAASGEPPSAEADGSPAGAASAAVPDAVQVQPAFHVAPVELAAPADVDVHNPMGRALEPPARQTVAAELGHLRTRGLTLGDIEGARRKRALSAGAGAAPVAPLAGAGVATYEPAQIRAAYGLPPLPPLGAALTAVQAAQLGAGQTIYIVNAHHNPNVVAELAAFNQKFGLPGCTTKAIATTSALPLPPASTTGCEFSVVYTTAAGVRTTAAPSYESGWATEIALDVQWAHATAPLARLVLIEAADASSSSLQAAIRLANAMGPGAVSMSFGATEGSWSASTATTFAGTGMTYLAATGDWGQQVSWPAVMPQVLGVGGTSLTTSGGARSEVAWSGTGGGISAYTARPAYQAATVPGLGTPVRRVVADVAFNADPQTGQYVAVMAPGASTVSWISAGGTSLSTPQWAGLVAIANALRAQAGKPVLGAAHAALYAGVASVPGTYAGSFADITLGSHGGCATCQAKAGFDQLTGLGTPHASALLAALTQLTSTTPAVAPVVTAATVSGKVGTALSHTVAVNAANAVSWSLSGAPAGMTISATGQIKWPSPAVGTRSVTAVATDSKTGAQGQATITFNVAPLAPTLKVPTLKGAAGKAFSASIAITAPGATSLNASITGMPAGMTATLTGQALTLHWPSPVRGTYRLGVTVTNQAGQSGKATATVTIAAK